MNRTGGLSAVLVAVLVVGAFSTGALALETGTEDLAVAVDGDSAVVTVTDNGTDVPNASVSVALASAETESATYAGVGNYTTGPNGSVDLPTPEENVSVDVTATVGNASAATNATLVADGDEAATFGERVSTFVQRLLDDGTTTDESLGGAVSAFVTANNPGADERPDHAGPPGHAGPDEAEEDGEDDDGDATDGDGNESEAVDEDDEADDERRGPPEHAGGDRGERGGDERHAAHGPSVTVAT